MHPLLNPILYTAAAGAVLFVLPRIPFLTNFLTIAGAFAGFISSILLIDQVGMSFSIHWLSIDTLTITADFQLTHLALLGLLFITFFGVMLSIFSVGYYSKKDISSYYYSFLLLSVSASCGIVLSDNLFMLLIFWEIATVLLFFLVNMGTGKANAAAGKSFVILGLSDVLLLFGIVIIWLNYGSIRISELQIATDTNLAMAVFIFFLTASLAKAGAIPVHSWIPSAAETAPTPIMAFLPAALDKILGIYLLAVINLSMFSVTGSMMTIMLVIGAVTVVFSVMMALIQHDLKKLLSFHAVSQVGYMVLGIGTASVVGIIGGLFHMINHSIYKSCLFLGSAAVEKKTGTTALEKLSGLARLLPITFISMTVAAFAISGIPPMNGFFSKWMIYQSLLEFNQPVYLIAAMFGSALTLASFVKVIHSLFLGAPSEEYKNVKKEGFWIGFPLLVLAALCIILGIFPGLLIDNYLIPAVSEYMPVSSYPSAGDAVWNPTMATALLLVGLFIGLLVLLVGKMLKRKEKDIFVGGSELAEDMSGIVPGTDFYRTISDMDGFNVAYRDGDKGTFDIYNLGGKAGNILVQLLRRVHNGVLSTYLSWCIIGLGILIFILVR